MFICDKLWWSAWSFQQLGEANLFANLIDDLNYCVEHSSWNKVGLILPRGVLYPAKGASLALLWMSASNLCSRKLIIIWSSYWRLITMQLGALFRKFRWDWAPGVKIVWGLRTDSQQQSSESHFENNAYVPFCDLLWSRITARIYSIILKPSGW